MRRRHLPEVTRIDRKLYSYLRNLARDEDTARDLAQQTFLKIRQLASCVRGRPSGREATATIDTGYTHKSHDVTDASFNWNCPPGDLRDQYTLEGFYHFYLSEHFAIWPNIQWVWKPSLNPAEDSIVYLQVRSQYDRN